MIAAMKKQPYSLDKDLKDTMMDKAGAGSERTIQRALSLLSCPGFVEVGGLTALVSACWLALIQSFLSARKLLKPVKPHTYS